MWYMPEDSESQYLFDGRFQKLASTLAAYATGRFKHGLERGVIPERAGQIPLFDCRVWQVPTLYDAYETFLWREKDAVKNAITMAASAHFSHKDLQGVNGATKKEMLRDIGYPFEMMPLRFRRGSYVQRVKVERMLNDAELAVIPKAHWPTAPVMRTEIKVVNLPEIGSRGDDPVKIFFPSVFDKKIHIPPIDEQLQASAGRSPYCMIRQDFVQLLGERTALQRMIESTPIDEVLDLGSLTARLEEIEHRISEAKRRLLVHST